MLPPPTEPQETHTDSAALLRMLSKLSKDGDFENPEHYKILKSLARKNDEQLLTVYRGSFGSKNDKAEENFDKEFFLENCVELAIEKTQPDSS